MNHPTDEQWGQYLFGEAGPDLNAKLKAHLAECTDCAREVAAMQRTVRQLDAWQLPEHPRQRRALDPMIKLAIAAAVVLAMGIGLGRLTAPKPVDVQSLRSEWRASLLEEVESARSAGEERMLRETTLALQTLARDMSATIAAGRQEDRTAFEAALDQLKQQRDIDYVSLRRDLETVASAADQQIRHAHLKIFELATTTTPQP